MSEDWSWPQSSLPAIPVPLLGVQTARTQIGAVQANGGRGQLTAASATLYTAPSVTTPLGATQKALLTSIIFCNTDVAARTVTFYLIESGGAVADNRAMWKDVSIPAKTTMTFEPQTPIPLESGETVRGLASVTTVVTYRVSVIELT
jgi:hypothetical protein